MTPERRAFLLRAAPPLLVGGVIALLPVPEGLKPQAWYYFALFAAVIVGVATEPIPPGAIGLAGVVIAAMSGLVFKNPTQAVNWALSGFGQPTIWLIFGAYVLSVGYEKTGLGKRIALLLTRRFGSSTLGLGYAITLTDLAVRHHLRPCHGPPSSLPRGRGERARAERQGLGPSPTPSG